MNKSLNNTDKAFKNLADQLEIDIATDGLWADIAQQLPPQKEKKKIAFFWWTGGLAMTLFVCTASYYLATILPHDSNKKDTITTQITAKTNENLAINCKETPHKQAIVATITHTSTAKIKSTQTLPFSFKNKLYKNKETRSNKIQKHTNSLTKQTGKQDIYIIQNKIGNSLKINHLTNSISTLPLRLLFIKKALSFSKPRLITPASKKLHGYIQLASGINQNWSQNTLKNEATENDNRFANEKDIHGLNANIMFGLQKNKWSLALGLNYAVQATRYTQKEEIITQRNVTGISQTQISDTGVKTDTEGQIIETTFQQYDITRHRIHKGLDIQAEIGRTFYRKGRFSLNAYAGIGYNIWSKHTGYYFEEEGNSITKLGNNTISPYKNKTGIKYNGAISFNYDIGKMNIGLSPFIKYSTTSILKNNAFYTLKNTQYGLQVRMTIRP